jgi:hypothetical protein
MELYFEIEDSLQASVTPLGLLCRRPHFSTFDAMVLSLIEVDSSVEVIFDGIIHHLMSYDKCFLDVHDSLFNAIHPGSRGAKSLILLGTLLDANLAVAEESNLYIFHEACTYLRGELGISVLSLFLSKNRTGVEAVKDGELPIHCAARHSCFEMFKFLHKTYPESISMLGECESSLLHIAACDDTSDIADTTAKMHVYAISVLF